MHPTTTVRPEPKDEAGRFSDRIVILGRILGSLGMVAVISTLLTWALTRELGWMIWAKLIFGGAAGAFYFVTNSRAFWRFAGSKATVYTTSSILTVVGFVGAMAAFNFIAASYNREVDLTKDRIFSLSDQTERVLGMLDKPVELFAFYRPEEPERSQVETLIGRYQAKTKHLALEFINPEKDPEAVKKYQITEAGPRVVMRAQNQDLMLKEVSEEEVTNTIVRLALQSPKKIAFLTGHGEADIASMEAEGYAAAASALVAEGYPVETLSLLDKTGVPEGIDLVVVAAPKVELVKTELEILDGFLIQGGHVLLMLEPGLDAGLKGLLADWKVDLGANTILDVNPVSQAYGFGPELLMVQKPEPHPITRGMKMAVAFPTARSVRAMGGGSKSASATEVLKTSPESWGETRYTPGQPVGRDAEDAGGPLAVMTASTKKPGGITTRSQQTRLLVVGDHEFANNRFIAMLGNRDLFLNAVNWLAQEEDRISIRPRTRGASRLLLSENEANFIKFLSIDVVPMLLLAVGVAVWQIQRRR